MQAVLKGKGSAEGRKKKGKRYTVEREIGKNKWRTEGKRDGGKKGLNQKDKSTDLNHNKANLNVPSSDDK